MKSKTEIKEEKGKKGEYVEENANEGKERERKQE